MGRLPVDWGRRSYSRQAFAGRFRVSSAELIRAKRCPSRYPQPSAEGLCHCNSAQMAKIPAIFQSSILRREFAGSNHITTRRAVQTTLIKSVQIMFINSDYVALLRELTPWLVQPAAETIITITNGSLVEIAGKAPLSDRTKTSFCMEKVASADSDVILRIESRHRVMLSRSVEKRALGGLATNEDPPVIVDADPIPDRK